MARQSLSQWGSGKIANDNQRLSAPVFLTIFPVIFCWIPTQNILFYRVVSAYPVHHGYSCFQSGSAMLWKKANSAMTYSFFPLSVLKDFLKGRLPWKERALLKCSLFSCSLPSCLTWEPIVGVELRSASEPLLQPAKAAGRCWTTRCCPAGP